MAIYAIVACAIALALGVALLLRRWLAKPFVAPFSLSLSVQERETGADSALLPSHDDGLGYERMEFFYTDGSKRAIYRSLTPGEPDLVAVSKPIPQRSRLWWRRLAMRQAAQKSE